MESRTLYDLEATIESFNHERDKSQDPDFGQKYFGFAELKVDEEDSINQRPTERFHLNAEPSYPMISHFQKYQNSQLCSRCHYMITCNNQWQKLTTTLYGDPLTDFQRISVRYQDLVESRKMECHMCHLQLNALQSSSMEKLMRVAYVEFLFARGKRDPTDFWSLGRSSTVQRIQIRYLVHDKNELVLLESESETDFTLQEVKTVCDSSNAGMSQVSKNNDTTIWDQISHWIRRCNTHHDICQRLRLQNQCLPTRLLKIDTGEPLALKVILTTNMAPDTRYITLSHTWGNSRFHQYIKTRTESYFDSIKVETLPRLFQDIVSIALKLQVFYIWIDAFCIKQGSEIDWIHESAKMGDVYAHSWCNIAASRAANNEETIFAHRNSLDVTPCIIHLPWDPDQKQWQVYMPEETWDRNIKQTPLSRRGWVVQELTLASRVLYFGSKQLFWECNQLRACETNPEGFPISVEKKLSVHSSSIKSCIKRVLPEDNLYCIWALLIEEFSTCLLTETPKDKLVAISGLAKRIAPAEQYLAGLWKKNLEYQLLWRVDGKAHRALEYQAPSWSWASINGGVRYRVREITHNPETELLISISVCHIDLHSLDPTGRVVGGHLIVKGPLVKADITYCMVNSRTMSCVNGAIGDLRVDDEDDLSWCKDCYCMPVEIKQGKGLKYRMIVGLLLHPHSSMFQRRAYFTAIDVKEDDEGAAHGLKGFWESFHDVSRMPYESLAKVSNDRTIAATAFGFPVYEFTFI